MVAVDGVTWVFHGWRWVIIEANVNGDCAACRKVESDEDQTEWALDEKERVGIKMGIRRTLVCFPWKECFKFKGEKVDEWWMLDAEG